MVFFPSVLLAESDFSTVNFRINMNQISHINEKEQTFDADFYLWVTRDQKDLVKPQFEIINAATYSNDSSEGMTWENTLDDRVETSMRIKGTFNSHMELSKFPFDHQSLQIIIEDFNSTENSMHYLPSKQESTISRDLKLSDWQIQSLHTQSQKYKYPFIDTGKTEESSYSRYVFSIQIERQ
ncbi:MAG: hypothetical protein Q9M28_05805 [Mariprofundaceae bacterium]|nr:hypothetical protein [Mariprofundaceae bacterium]